MEKNKVVGLTKKQQSAKYWKKSIKKVLKYRVKKGWTQASINLVPKIYELEDWECYIRSLPLFNDLEVNIETKSFNPCDDFSGIYFIEVAWWKK